MFRITCNDFLHTNQALDQPTLIMQALQSILCQKTSVKKSCTKKQRVHKTNFIAHKHVHGSKTTNERERAGKTKFR